MFLPLAKGPCPTCAQGARGCREVCAHWRATGLDGRMIRVAKAGRVEESAAPYAVLVLTALSCFTYMGRAALALCRKTWIRSFGFRYTATCQDTSTGPVRACAVT